MKSVYKSSSAKHTQLCKMFAEDWLLDQTGNSDKPHKGF